jgi:hypothetical protein
MVMSTEGDRRAPGATRIPFDAVVEVGGALGPSFEAHAVNISEEGMHLRTAYLPEVGQPLTCRFEAGGGATVLAAGEVAWAEDMGRGGEFGLRFTGLDPHSAEVLTRIIGMGYAAVPQPRGTKVRLHIDGLGSPMRARVKNMTGSVVTAFSELGFLQVGKQLELEDAETGDKRPAVIDRVEVEVDVASRVPQLVVGLRYDDEQARIEAEAARAMPKETTPGPSTIEDDPAPAPEAPAIEAKDAPDDTLGDVPATAAAQEAEPEPEIPMQGAFARHAAKVGPAMTKAMSNAWTRAKVTLALLAAKRRGGSGDDVVIPLRRVTSPPPGGGLHAAGRKVIRGEIGGDEPEAPKPTSFVAKHKRRIVLGGAIGLAALLAAVALKKPAAPPPLAAAPADTTMNAATSPVVQMPAATITPNGATTGDPAVGLPTAPPPGASTADMPGSNDRPGKHGKVAPFGNGPVTHGNMLHLKMDGPIDRINGAPTANGFMVTIPGRRSLEAAGPLAQRDARIASLRVSNETPGAELAITFKDGVPRYQVRAKGDTLEIALAPMGADKPAHPPSANKKKKGKHEKR